MWWVADCRRLMADVCGKSSQLTVIVWGPITTLYLLPCGLFNFFFNFISPPPHPNCINFSKSSSDNSPSSVPHQFCFIDSPFYSVDFWPRHALMLNNSSFIYCVWSTSDNVSEFSFLPHQPTSTNSSHHSVGGLIEKQ